MKKTLLGLLSILSVTCLAVGISACGSEQNNTFSTDSEESLSYSENLAYIISEDKSYYTLRGLGLCADRDVIIPETYRDLPVKEIANGALDGGDLISSITIPTSVTKIGSADAPQTVYFAGTLAMWCNIEFDNNWEDAFLQETTELYINGELIAGELSIPDTVTTLRNGVFSRYEAITSVTLPSSLTSIGENVFCACHNLASVSIPDSVTSIGKDAFNNCSNLINVTIPSTVQTIGVRAFDDCKTILCEATEKPKGWDLEWTNAPIVWNCKNNDVANDGYVYTFIDDLYYKLKDGQATVLGGANSISNLIIPNSITYNSVAYAVTVIEPNSFYGCENLTSIVIGDNVTDICMLAFSQNKRLTNVIIGDGVTTISSNAFAGCEYLTNVKLGKSVSIIMSFAFHDCKRLTTITIPESVCEIGGQVFTNCVSLTSVIFENSADWKNNYLEPVDFSDPMQAAKILKNGWGSFHTWEIVLNG